MVKPLKCCARQTGISHLSNSATWIHHEYTAKKIYSEVYKSTKIYLNQQTQLWIKLNVYKYYISRTLILGKTILFLILKTSWKIQIHHQHIFLKLELDKLQNLRKPEVNFNPQTGKHCFFFFLIQSTVHLWCKVISRLYLVCHKSVTTRAKFDPCDKEKLSGVL